MVSVRVVHPYLLHFYCEDINVLYALPLCFKFEFTSRCELFVRLIVPESVDKNGVLASFVKTIEIRISHNKSIRFSI